MPPIYFLVVYGLLTRVNSREDCERDEEGEEDVEALREALDEHGPAQVGSG